MLSVPKDKLYMDSMLAPGTYVGVRRKSTHAMGFMEGNMCENLCRTKFDTFGNARRLVKAPGGLQSPSKLLGMTCA
jgi:hypothetical protein